MALDLGVVAPNVVRADGQGRVVMELVRAAASAGHAVTVYAGRLDDEIASLDRVRWRPMPGGTGPRLLADAAFSAAATRAVRAAGHDIVCVKGPCAQPDRPYVFYASFCWDAWRRTAAEIARLVPGEPSRAGLYHRTHWAISARAERRALRGASRVLAVSRLVASEISTATGGSVPVTVVPNGVDSQEFHPATAADRRAARDRLGLREGDFAIAFVGEYNTPRKGLTALAEAVARSDDPRERLIVAGDGPARRLGPLAGTDRAVLLGHAAVAPVLAAADMVAVPSLAEPFSLVALEAAACGLPVALSARAGAADHLSGAALLVDRPHDPAAIRGAIDTIKRDSEAAVRMGRAARAAAESLDWRATAAAAVAEIEQVAALERESA